MSTFFNTNQPQTATNNTGLFGNATNQLNYQGVGLNNQQVGQNLLVNNVQQPTVLDSRTTVRQLTTLLPEWKGHFDLADHLLTSQEQTLVNVSMLVSQLQNIYENLLSTFDFSKSSLNDINLQQDKLNNDLSERLKYQDLQNLVTIKSRRLCEVIISNHPSTDVSSAFRIPNHINVQVSKELYERVRNLKNEIDFIQNEVQLLKEIDVFQAPTFIESVLTSHDSRITNLGGSLTKLLNRAESVLNKDLKREVWSGLSVDSSSLRKNFLDAIGMESTKQESDSTPLTEVKKQINYLKKFNSSYHDPNLQYMRDYGYNIKDLLVNTVPNESLMMPGPNFQMGGMNLVTGAPGMFGQTLNQNQPFGSGLLGSTTTPGLGGSSSNLFGSTTGTGTTGFGTQPSGGLTSFGSGSNLLQSSTGGSSHLYAQQFQKQQPMGTTQFGTTPGLGSTTFGTTGTPGLGPTAFGTTQTQLGVGSATGTTGSGLFGSTTSLGTTQTTTGSGLFGSTTTGTGTSGFGSTTTGGGLFGSSTTPGTGFGTTSGFGTTTQTSGLGTGFGSATTQPSTGLFGSSTTTGTTGSGLFGTTGTTTTGTSPFGGTTSTGFGFGQTGLGGTQNQSSGLFGHSSTGTGSSANLLGTGTASSNLFGSTTGTGTTGFGSTTTTGFGSTTGTSGFGNTTGTTGTGLFGSSTTGTGTSGSGLFGSTSTSPFGNTTSTGFGSNTGLGFGSSTTGTGTGFGTSSGFGTSTGTTGSGLFGSTTTGTGTSGFGSTTTGGGLFGSSTTPGTGFGSSTSTGLGGSSSNLFGSSTSSTSLFGSTTQNKPPGTELALYTNPTPGLNLNRT